MQLRVIAENIRLLPKLCVLHISGVKSAIPPEICAVGDLRVQYLKRESPKKRDVYHLVDFL